MPKLLTNSSLLGRTARSHFFQRQAQFALDLGVLGAAFVIAYLLRFEFRLPAHETRHLLIQLPMAVLLQFAMLFLTGIYTFIWRYIGLAEVQAFLRAAVYSFTPLLLLRVGLPETFQDWRIPLSVLLIDTVLAFGGLLGMRVLRRVVYEQDARRKRTMSGAVGEQKPVLLIGAGQAGVTVAREMVRRGDLAVEPIGFVDDDPEKIGSVVYGLRVLGSTQDIPRLVTQQRIDHVILTIVEASRNDIRRILEICEQAPVRVRVIPGLHEVIEGRVEFSRIRDVEIEDLLGREPVRLEEDSLASFLTERSVCITGAGGSIGSELTRQALRFDPRRLVLVDRSELALFEIERSLRNSGIARPVECVLADVADESSVRRLFDRYRPDVVLHAAAYKHVPMMEFNPVEAIRNNSLATAALARRAGEAGCESFVLVSTDKAVRPTSVMGASKRVAEIAVQDLSRKFPNTRFLAVRFGNVLGSTGSVVPLFREQIENGGPVTVTHPSVKRFFMTPSEAAQLVLQAGAIGNSGEILVLDMGEPISISQLAQDMIRLSGLKPFADIDIQYTGLRPGEKLYEELELTGENISKTRHPKIFVGRIAPLPPDRVDFTLRRLTELAAKDEQNAIRSFLADLLPEATLDVRGPEAESRQMWRDQPS